jgi:peptide-methionine (S)-S-oxide reductase
MESKTETAIFGGGCFWCTEAVFNMLRGVISVEPGYAGGTKENPSYDNVSSGTTGHAEVIHIEYNPSEVSYRDLLTVFFGSHDPTTLNRQGADVGTQYRSVIFWTSDIQKVEAEAFIKELNDSNAAGDPVVTEVKPLEKFNPAENEHHDYYTNQMARDWAKKYDDIIFLAGRYEGIDARAPKILKAETISVGPFVLTGGELPAMIVIDALARQIPGVLGKFESVEEERTASPDVYTRPEVLEWKKKKYRVPKVLLSGNHKEIEIWKTNQLARINAKVTRKDDAPRPA